MAPTSGRKRKKVRYSKVVFKLSLAEKRRLEKIARHSKTTTVKVIKASIRDYLKRNSHLLQEQEPVAKNQLKLFDTDKDIPVQMTIDMVIEEVQGKEG